MPYVHLFTVTRSFASSSPIRAPSSSTSRRHAISSGFAARMRASRAPNGRTASYASGLRFLQGTNSFPDVSTVATRILVTQSTQRLLQIWRSGDAQTAGLEWFGLHNAGDLQSGLGISRCRHQCTIRVDLADREGRSQRDGQFRRQPRQPRRPALPRPPADGKLSLASGPTLHQTARARLV